ncbi:MAG: diaminopimelate decarboxylase [Candidatus Binatus sp.]|uniref:diaminopimelate decarboxylase n=1 Tax=Candidatus Binatus sp. TaxID=2811406 RepID=UPI00272813A9|nr:diaminopimelate decarboxylase [Candidatus Binatus sp.]MDO8434627.1 diaminopimelate decarboxylase [Candidatus Binatus sp.]
MNYFDYRDDQLYAEDVSIADLAARIGTPLYVYSARTLRRHFRVFDEAFAGTDHLICYAMKALSNLSILKLFASLGAGFDIVSVGELMRCLRVGADPGKIVFSGVGKTDEEIAAALEAGILMINVESRPELHRIAEVAGRMKRRAPVSLRVNPDLNPGTHPHISTGHRDSKFGVPLSQVDEYYAEARSLKNLEIVGLSTHIGSQISELDPFTEAGEKVAAIVGRLRTAGIMLKCLDLGGGLGIPYQEAMPLPSEYAAALLKPIAGLGLKIITEPGRVIVGNAGILVTRVLYNKETDVKRFVVIDGAMNDLIRPVLYEAYHNIIPVDRRKPGHSVTADVVGPVCESGDFFARDREMPEPKSGDLLAVMSAGAYGFVMSSNYNSRPRAPEILVDGADAHVIRERESFDDLVRGENIVTLKPASA